MHAQAFHKLETHDPRCPVRILIQGDASLFELLGGGEGKVSQTATSAEG